MVSQKEHFFIATLWCHKKNTFLSQLCLILYTPKQIYAFREKKKVKKKKKKKSFQKKKKKVSYLYTLIFFHRSKADLCIPRKKKS